MRKDHHVFLRVFLCALLLFTVYVLLDTFVIERRIETAAEPQTASAAVDSETEPSAALPLAASPGEKAETVVTENSYHDGSISIDITEERVGDTTVYVADVHLASAEYLKTAFADNTYGRNVTDTTSAIAESVGAILAVNGDFYGAQQSGFVIRGGVLYRSAAKKGAEDLVIDADGSFGIIREAEITAQALLDSGARDVLSFGPALVENGEISVSVNDEVGRAKASNPRTAIAVIDELHYLFVVSDGRTSESEGLSLYELAAYLQSKGVQTAYNLDGGGSSTMVFNGRVVNNPTSGRSVKERSVSDIVYVG
ncbi:MAG: phosphodiester glycosidase family protein [Oscillospiraceae bacterium]|nr:phosphodiester glycosidase family protein [Oscillospiraceae bacterium]